MDSFLQNGSAHENPGILRPMVFHGVSLLLKFKLFGGIFMFNSKGF